MARTGSSEFSREADWGTEEIRQGHAGRIVSDVIVGYYTLATGQIDFGDLPAQVAKKLPRRILPAAILSRDSRLHRRQR